MKKELHVKKKKIYITAAIISIIVAIFTSFIFGKIGELLINGESFKNVKAFDLTLWFIQILFILIFNSILAVIVTCDVGKKNK